MVILVDLALATMGAGVADVARSPVAGGRLVELGYIVSAVAAASGLPTGLYLLAMSVLSRVRPSPPPPPAARHFAIVVPAHNEAAQIAQTVSSLVALDYTSEHVDIVVVADNCTDDTAAIARAAGARVLVREHATHRGKGYALDFAFASLLQAGQCEAIVVVDADSVVSKNMLQAFAARLSAGALAVQAHYGVRNPEASWRTRLMAVALGMFHRLRSLARESLGVSCGLRGNGMCFSRQVLVQHAHHAFGLVEDVEYGIALGLGGVRVVYADEAHVLGEMVSGGRASESQRQRWEVGRAQLRRQKLPQLIQAAWRRRSLMLADLAMDLMTPPLSTVGLGVAMGVALEVTLRVAGAETHVATTLWAINLTGLLAYVVRGAALSGLGLGAFTALAWAPFYVGWKLVLRLRPGQRKDGWVRTAREGEGGPSAKM